MDKDVIKVEGFKKTTKNYARTFIPVKNREEFLVGQIIDKKTTLAARKRIYSYLIEKESNLEMIEFIQKLLEERKEEIKVKQNKCAEFRHIERKPALPDWSLRGKYKKLIKE